LSSDLSMFSRFSVPALAAALLSLLSIASIAFAGYKEDIGFTALQAELGAATPDGSSLPLVTQCEAESLIDHEADGRTDKVPVWMPDPANREFSGKKIVDKSGSPPVYSGHATGVGSRFYGKTSSIAPGIASIESYLATDWLDQGFLKGNGAFKPAYTGGRVANHSWIGSAAGRDPGDLRRIDWVVGTDEYVQVVGPCRDHKPLLGSAFNTIAVGSAAGESGAGSIAVDAVYAAGRTCPQLVAPLKNASSTVPVVAAAAALLIELGHTDPGLSRDPAVRHTTNRNGDTITNAERSVVVKAALMAGADRATHNSVMIDGITPNIDDYRMKPEDRTADGLDRRYGAGQLNIYNSYHIIAAGEQNSREDAPAAGGAISDHGFDYDPFFGGQGGSNSVASYQFAVGKASGRLWAALVWNIDIDAGGGPYFVGSAALYDMDLLLYDVTEPAAPQLVAASSGSGGNTENLWVELNGKRQYRLQVSPGAGQRAFSWDYALAWRIESQDGRKPGER
jgi:hypothetical protein